MASRPRMQLLGMEVARAGREFGSYLGSRRAFRQAPKGDGHPVLVMPGLLGGDGSTRAARAFLRSLDYHVHAWQLGRNWGPTDRILDGLGDRFRGLVEEHGQKISLVGHSLGGIYARELARRAPDYVRNVVTLGSPVRLGERMSSNAEPVVRALQGRYSERAKGGLPPGEIHETVGVPLTAIMTMTDGVVHWKSCVIERGSMAECIVVKGSHSGLIHNPAALLVVADRLAQPEGEWLPFEEREGVSAHQFVPRTTS
jgi:pimeloyl-ACP methyl ester carboxylesterase